MALVTVQRSPTPSNSPELFDEQQSCISELCQCSSGTATPCSQKTCRTTLRQRSLSECYFAVKGAAVILPQNECLAMPRQSNSAGGDIQLHLHAMLHLLRPHDTLKMAVRLESLLGKHTRYMAIVSTNGRQDTQESIILGIDYVGPQDITIGLVLPIWASTRIALDGDGGICVESNGSHHVFKPVSVQAMWSVFQSLHKEHAIATRYPYYPGGLSHTWTQYYETRISSPEAFRSEWHYTYQDDSDLKADSLDRFKEKPPERAAAEKLIRMTLKDIMQSVDLDEVTSKDIRTKLEDKLEMNLIEYKEFIDEEMLVILGQMDKPSQIFPYLYLGSEWNASNFDELKQNNVGHILNVTKEVDNFFPGLFFYMKVSVSDEESTELLKYWDSTFRFIFKAREKNSAVLVHCKKGISRSSSTVIAYAMKAYGWSVEEALKHVKEKRNCITPNKGFMEQLRTYQGILDASRNRNSALFNQLKLTPSEPELVPWDGLCDEEELKRPGIDPLGVVYSKKLDNAAVMAIPGLLVASENILKSGPSSEYAFPTSSCNSALVGEYIGKEESQQNASGNMNLVHAPFYQESLVVSQMAAHRWISPPVTGVVGNLTSKFEGACRIGAYMGGDTVQQPDSAIEKDLDILEFEATMLWRDIKEERLPEVCSRPPLRKQLLNVEERIRDQQLTLRNVQEILMRRGSHSPTTSDSYSLSSGDESDPCNGGANLVANVKQRRNSKSSSGDSAIADLTRFPSGADWPTEIQTSTGGAGEMAPLAQSCPADSFVFMNVPTTGGGEADAMNLRRPMTIGMETGAPAGIFTVEEAHVVPPGQVRRVTMQYERGLTAANNRRSSPALMSLEKEESGLQPPPPPPKPIPVVMESPRRQGQPPRCGDLERQKATRHNSTPAPFSTKRFGTGKRFFGRLFSTKKDQVNLESGYSESKYGTSLLKSGQTTWYDELRKRAANTSTGAANASVAERNAKNRPKSDGYKIWTGRDQQPRSNYNESSSLTSPTKVSLKVSEPGKVRTRKEKFEGRHGLNCGTGGGYASSGIGAASIWMATSHEGSVKRITIDLESRCQNSMTPLMQRASFDGGRQMEQDGKKVKSIVGHFEPSKRRNMPPVPVVKSNSGGHQQHGTYPIGSAQRKRAPTSWMRHGSWFDLPSCGDRRDDARKVDAEPAGPLRRVGSYTAYSKRVPESPEPIGRSRSLTRHCMPPRARRCASAAVNSCAAYSGENCL